MLQNVVTNSLPLLNQSESSSRFKIHWFYEKETKSSKSQIGKIRQYLYTLWTFEHIISKYSTADMRLQLIWFSIVVGRWSGKSHIV